MCDSLVEAQNFIGDRFERIPILYQASAVSTHRLPQDGIVQEEDQGARQLRHVAFDHDTCRCSGESS